MLPYIAYMDPMGFNSSPWEMAQPWYRWPIEIDGLPINILVIFHGKLLNNQMAINHGIVNAMAIYPPRRSIKSLLMIYHV